MLNPKTSINWAGTVINRAKAFAAAHGATYHVSKSQLSAVFEVGCFLALENFYAEKCRIRVENLRNGEFRYLTTPSGNPDNYSFLSIESPDGTFWMRQQIRIRSHLHRDVCFTPDIVVLRDNATLSREFDPSYAGGKRTFFVTASDYVVAAHECKSLNPFPELFVGFVGSLYVAHDWVTAGQPSMKISRRGIHLAPTLFVGGTAKSKHKEMIAGLQQCLPLNIVVGMHRGNMNLRGISPPLTKIKSSGTS